MKAFYKTAALSAVVFSTLAVIGAAGSGAAMASDGGPNGAYCLRNTESGSWCGFATFSQCEESASGTGGDCVANVFGEEEHSNLGTGSVRVLSSERGCAQRRRTKSRSGFGIDGSDARCVRRGR
jgi:Protein of unknown function (DUF3551)